jgi:CRISPR-associated Csx3 family protein
MDEQITIRVSRLYVSTSNAKLADLQKYVEKVLDLAGEGNEVVLTGQGPIWLYLKIAHSLHSVARKLIYRSPVTGDVVIFDHSPD